jgi:hypothetical protein
VSEPWRCASYRLVKIDVKQKVVLVLLQVSLFSSEISRSSSIFASIAGQLSIMFWNSIVTYDHRSVKTGHPVRSAIHKH